MDLDQLKSLAQLMKDFELTKIQVNGARVTLERLPEVKFEPFDESLLEKDKPNPYAAQDRAADFFTTGKLDEK